MEYQELKDNLNKFTALYLYGAGVVAYGAYKAVQELFGIKVNAFLVTAKDNQLDQIDGIPIHVFNDMRIKRDSLILIAAPEEYHGSIEQALQKRGILNYIKLDSHAEYVLMGEYLKRLFSLRLIEDYQAYYSAGQEESKRILSSAGVYMAVSHADRKLEKTYKEEPWVKKIQVGSVLTRKRIAALTDGECESFSEQNALYGELSATYFAWKYGIYDVTGIFHYRRILRITEGQMQLLKDKILDVILPLPFVCYPDASGQYGRYLLKSDVNILLQVLKEKSQKDFEIIKKLLKMPYLYNYNILVARKEVFDDYCDWIFTRLKEIEHRCEKDKKERMPRYIGRIGEILTSLYFMRNEKEWRIAHAEKIWRV